MSKSSSDVINSVSESDLIEFAKTVELSATRVLEGLHHSRRGGQGLEFHSNSPYSEGEDARFIDWKRFASTDRYFVNRFEREEKTGWFLVIDTSGSMNYGLKKDWADKFAGALLFLANVWGDRFSIFPMGALPIQETFRALKSNESGLKNPADFSHSDFRSLGRAQNDRLVVISDFFWEDEVLENFKRVALDEFSTLYLIQILDPKEKTLEFVSPSTLEFCDMESSEKLVLDSKSIRQQYTSLLKQQQEKMDEDLTERSFRMTFTVGETGLENQLFRFYEHLERSEAL